MSKIKIGDEEIDDENLKDSSFEKSKNNTIELMELIINADLSTADDIQKICFLIKDKFKNARLMYSIISDRIYVLEEWQLNDLESACDMLVEYSDKWIDDPDGKIVNKVVLKLADHINLALTQERYVQRYNDNALQEKIDEVQGFMDNASDLKTKIDNMNTQIISVLGIFTAISFILFGGISSAASILDKLGNPSLPLLLVFGSIWGLIVFNAVYFLLYYISKLTNISIKTNLRQGASIFRRHPYICLMNFFLSSSLVIGMWGYLIETTTGTQWLDMIVKKNQDFLLFGSFTIVLVILIIFIFIVFKIKDDSKDYNY